ncbi:MAG: SUF system NifU family Fe-S cluster assembly protein [Tenericutes bacterium]|nr:SUF system NifU family Fe-S cluster assembly protein [Bacilli bacterium]NLV90023.1 SUF system NifU family Fe-S cluster assembly protein [Mycoplasmatota bacterium]
MNYSNDLYRNIILDHIENPKNKKEINSQEYLKSYLKNPACGDDVLIYVLIDKDIIKDVSYDVNGCTVCKASTSIMSELLIGKTLKEVDIIINNINNMLVGKDFDKNIIKDAIAFEGIKNLPPRIKCAILPYKAFKKAIGDKDEL